MPKHRGTVYTVVREVQNLEYINEVAYHSWWEFSGLVGTYVTISRAEEVAAATMQHYIDSGMDVDNPEYRCTVKPVTFYDE